MLTKTYTCQKCNKSFQSSKGYKTRTPKFCSRNCSNESKKIHKYCKLCGDEIITNGASKAKRIYCSKSCQSESRRGIKLSDKWCKALSEGRKNSDKCKGKNLYNWKGGVENRKRQNLNFYHSRRASGKLDQSYLKILFIIQKGKCFYCQKDISDYKAIEHLNPISKGGNNNWINLVYSCKSCNSKKKDSTFAEFAVKNHRPDWLNNMVQFQAKQILDYVNKKQENS